MNNPNPSPQSQRCSLSASEISERLQVDLQQGLTSEEASQRQLSYGRNEIQEGKRRPLWRMMMDQFRDFMIMVLLAAAIISGLIGEAVDTIAILIIVFLNGINLVTDGLQGLALAVEPHEKGILQRPPRPPNENIFAHGIWQHIVWVGLLIGGLSLLAQALC